MHGPAAINSDIVNSSAINARFDLHIIPLRFARKLDELNRMTLGKLMRALSLGAMLFWRLLFHRPALVYLTLAPTGAAFYRDCLYVFIMKLFNVRRVYHLHGKGISRKLRKPLVRALYRWAFEGAWVIHLSDLLVPDIAELIPPERTLVVANGIQDRNPGNETSELDVHPASIQPVRVLYLSNMIESKGPLILLEALAMLKDRDLRFSATFAGARFNDGCVERFHEQVAAHDLGQWVEYVGPAYDEKKWDLFKASDIFVFPTYNDCQPVALIEAMQFSLPIVSTREGAIPDMVVDGVTGFLTPKQDPVALAAKLSLLIEDPELRFRMGDASRGRYLERFSSPMFEQNLITALTRCMTGSS